MVRGKRSSLPSPYRSRVAGPGEWVGNGLEERAGEK